MASVYLGVASKNLIFLKEWFHPPLTARKMRENSEFCYRKESIFISNHTNKTPIALDTSPTHSKKNDNNNKPRPHRADSPDSAYHGGSSTNLEAICWTMVEELAKLSISRYLMKTTKKMMKVTKGIPNRFMWNYRWGPKDRFQWSGRLE